MKKNYSFVFALFLSMCLLSSCAVSPGTSHGDLSMDSDVPSVAKDSAQQIENNKPMDEGLNVNPSGLDGKVSMTVAADTAGSLDITITNNSDVDIDMGEDFSLQKMDSETWKDIPLSLNYVDNLIVISPNESYTFHYDIGRTVDLESNITYQIVKVVSTGQTNHSVFASFEIK